jgi:hypothetical protein
MPPYWPMTHAMPYCTKTAITGFWIRIWQRLCARQAILDLPSGSPAIWQHSNSHDKHGHAPHYVLAPHQWYMGLYYAILFLYVFFLFLQEINKISFLPVKSF